MDSRLGFYIFIVVLIVVLQIIMRAVRGRFAKAKVSPEDGVQKPGGFDRGILLLFKGLIIFSALFTILGLIMQETEMTIAFGVMTVIFILINFFLTRKYNMTYQENEEYFVFMKENKEYKVYYEDITDWSPSHNEILILDRKENNGQYIPVNITVFQTNILMRKLLDKAAAGDFDTMGSIEDSQDELIYFLRNNHYGHIVEQHINSQ